MSVKIGFIDDNTNSNLKTFVDQVRININDSDRADFQLGADQLSGIRRSKKAVITLEFDRMSQANVSLLRKVIDDRVKPHKFFINEPNDTEQINTFVGITNPSSTHVGKKAVTDNADLSFASGAEFSTGEYGDINSFGAASEVIASTSSAKFGYLFFRFKITPWLALSAITLDDIERLTLVMETPRAFETGGVSDVDLGLKIDAFNNGTSKFTEIKRMGVTVSESNQQFASIRPVANFTNFADYVDGSDQIIFRVRNLQERTADTLKVQMLYAEMIINGYGCVQTNSDNFTFRDTFTGAGKTGVLELAEL